MVARLRRVHSCGADNRRTLTFRFADYGNIDAVDFHTDCAPRLDVGHLKVHDDPVGAEYCIRPA
jgi:hypothetical protein